MDMKALNKQVKEFVQEFGKDNCKQAGLGAVVSAVYTGMRLEDVLPACDWPEVAADLELSRQEIWYWEDLWYKNTSWLNKA